MRLSWPEIPRSGWPEGQWALHLFISAIRVAVQQLGCRIENYFCQSPTTPQLTVPLNLYVEKWQLCDAFMSPVYLV